MNKHYDIAIAGAGMVGSLLACALSKSGFEVALIESQDWKHFDPASDYDMRVSAISLASQRMFENLGVWQAISAQRFCPYHEMHVWDHAGEGEIHFNNTELGIECLGAIIENKLIVSALHSQLMDNENIHMFQNTAIAELNVTNYSPSVALALQDGTQLTADLVVGSDGAASKTRTLAGISVIEKAYQQEGVVAIVKTEKIHATTAWQRFLSTGPLAFLPLADGRCSIVWSTSPDHASSLKSMSDDEFCNELESAFESKLGKIENTTSRVSFPLKYLHADTYIKPGIVLVGDAAHVIHPLAGQGVNLGFLDAAHLVDCLNKARANKLPLGSRASLRPYERCRKSENQMMLMAMDGIKNLFGHPSSAISSLRNLGLNLVNQVGPVKRIFMERAIGVGGEAPTLAKLI